MLLHTFMPHGTCNHATRNNTQLGACMHACYALRRKCLQTHTARHRRLLNCDRPAPLLEPMPAHARTRACAYSSSSSPRHSRPTPPRHPTTPPAPIVCFPRAQSQSFGQAGINVNCGMLILATFAVVLASLLDATQTERNDGHSELALSRFMSICMVLCYGVYLLFQLKTHRWGVAGAGCGWGGAHRRCPPPLVLHTIPIAPTYVVYIAAPPPTTVRSMYLPCRPPPPPPDVP